MKKLNWKYCECGCRGFEIHAAGLYFWYYDDLKGNMYLHSGHGHYALKIGKHEYDYDHYDDMTTEVVKRFSEGLDELKNILRRI